MTPELSVVVCCHNPRPNYLDRVLKALSEQTLAMQKWELIVVDNASSLPISERWDLGWHPQGQIVMEDTLGLTSARTRGISEGKGSLVVFVDDDNVLATDYLERASEIATTFPYIGAFGGSVKGEFELIPERWTQKYFSLLAVRELNTDTWSNLLSWNDGTPYGAGLCVRREVADDWLSKVCRDDRRRTLGRVGTGTGSAEDKDLAYCAIDLGLGIGTFKRLKMIHIIPKQRLSVSYLCRLTAGIQASDVVLQSFRPSAVSVTKSYKLAMMGRLLGKLTLSPTVDGRIELAANVGRRRGYNFLRRAPTDRGVCDLGTWL